MNLYSLLEQASQRFPGHGAVYVGADRVWTYAELRSRSLRLARSLGNRHRPGERNAIASENRAEYLELLFDVWAAEGVAVPLDFKLHPKEMVQIIQDADTSAVFVSPNYLAAFVTMAYQGRFETGSVAGGWWLWCTFLRSRPTHQLCGIDSCQEGGISRNG